MPIATELPTTFRPTGAIERRLFTLDPPIPATAGRELRYVVASTALGAHGDLETLVFPSNSHGEVASFKELTRTLGAIDTALRALGYHLVEEL